MVFSSEAFLYVFLPVALAVYYAAGWLPGGLRARHVVLTLFSYLFYGWANPLFTLLMLGSTVIDYVLGRVLVMGEVSDDPAALPQLVPGTPRSTRQKAAVWASVATNLGLLGFFKYFNFGVDSYAAVADATGLPGLDPSLVLQVTLPLGISFYTFQSMSYSIDVYRGHARPLKSFVDFACYVSMFPQLVAGPIIRFSEVATQLRDRTHTVAWFARGIAFFGLGLAKKVCLANPAAEVADLVFDAPSVAAAEAWLGTFAYAMQIYFDFSGYSDMAIGLGLMLGFSFPKNFDAPYRSRSITEFWQRWHLSLSSWLRDYLYISLGGNRRGERRTYVNLALVMLFGGLWHGASWNFVVWGAIHGLMLGFERAQGKDSVYRRLAPPLKVAITFGLVCFAWVFFRAPTLPAALHHLEAMVGLGAPAPSAMAVRALAWAPWNLAMLALSAVVVWGAPWQTWDFTRRLSPARAALAMGALLLALVQLSTQSYNPFIYFLF